MAEAILLIILGYAAVGAGFGVPFLLRGIDRIDPAARGSPWTFRLLILPGVIALWPVLARRWRRAPRPEGAP
ncbi:MAG: hypothetical protein C4547_16240 [Phycisphaerales bacterium]|nr:MAG: hypothetical protein C4547_16240 [Phycisphaerales bacterium]